MTRFLAILGIVLAVAGGLLWWLLGRPAPPTTSRSAVGQPAGAAAATSREPSGGTTTPAPRPALPDAAVRTDVKDIPVRDVDVAADRKMRAEHELAYRISRLRFLLAENASHCYSGPPRPEQVLLGYELVIAKEVIAVRNVVVRESSIRDSSLQNCLVTAVRDMTSLADGVPDQVIAQQSWISLADLANVTKRQREAPTEP